MGNCRKFKCSVTLALDGVKVTSTYSTCWTSSLPNDVTAASRTTEIWPFEFREISILDSHDRCPRRKFKNQAPTSCSPGHILSPATISFELHAKMAEEIDLEKCNFRNFGSSVTLTLDRVEVTLVRISGRSLPTYQIRWILEKLFVDVCTYGRVQTDGHT